MHLRVTPRKNERMLPFLRGVNDVLNAQKVREVPEWLCMDMIRARCDAC